jgi:hypothetical protein
MLYQEHYNNYIRYTYVYVNTSPCMILYMFSLYYYNNNKDCITIIMFAKMDISK